MKRLFFLVLVTISLASATVLAGGLGIPSSESGLGFGNLTRFSGIRFNLVDNGVDSVAGINTTFWIPKDNEHAHYQGINLGLVGSEGDKMEGLSFGLIGLAYEEMLFFDDEHRNIDSVGSLGVVSCHVDRGVTEAHFARGLQAWRLAKPSVRLS